MSSAAQQGTGRNTGTLAFANNTSIVSVGAAGNMNSTELFVPNNTLLQDDEAMTPDQGAASFPLEVLERRALKVAGTLRKYVDKAKFLVDMSGSRRLNFTATADVTMKTEVWILVNRITKRVEMLKIIDEYVVGHAAAHPRKVALLRERIARAVADGQEIENYVHQLLC